MMTFAISTVFGAMLGPRFKVLVLFPIILLGSAVTTGIGIVNGKHAGSIILACILFAVCVQLGYLVGAVMASRSRSASYYKRIA